MIAKINKVMNKICTSLEQTKKLIELGIDVNTADMHYVLIDCDKEIYYIGLVNYIGILPHHPAWSLTALLGVIPKHIKNYNVLRIDISDNDFAIWYDDISNGCVNETLPDITMESAVDACYEMVVRLKESNKI